MHPSDRPTSDKPREFCGVFGVYGVPNAAQHIYNGLFSLQHRGQEGSGIVVSDGEEVRSAKVMPVAARMAAQ